jgi:multisubunit Na+/H+ antiporter MnhB subunit
MAPPRDGGAMAAGAVCAIAVTAIDAHTGHAPRDAESSSFAPLCPTANAVVYIAIYTH